MGKITTSELNTLIGKIKDKSLPGAIYHDKYPLALGQSGPSCGVYSLKWAIDYRSLKTGIKGELLPARARDVCANCGIELRGGEDNPRSGLKKDTFGQNVTAIRADGKEKKSYYCDTCKNLPNKRKLIKSMRSLAKANNLSVMGELMEPSRLLKLAQLSGFAEQATLIDVSEGKKPYEECLKASIDGGKMALLIYDINPQTGGPGLNAGTKAHWCTVFGYYKDKDALHLLVVHGWGAFYDWPADELMKSVAQMKLHPGWDLRVPTTKTVNANESFKGGAVPRGKESFKLDGLTKVRDLDADREKSVDVPGMDYSKVNSQFVEFG
jgi:hypothetical protein